MVESLVLLLGAIFVISSAVLLVLQHERRDIIFERLHLKRRRDSGSRTPPRSLSPEKKRTLSVSVPDYSTTFPPSRRQALTEEKAQSKTVENVAASQSDWTKRMLPLTTSYLDTSNDMYTPCEFSVGEIKALGNFPDYATLSGVPLPKPYHEFDIKKALPRPYRPFRWAYHQTMGQ